MSFDLRIDADHAVLEVIYAGVVTGTELFEATRIAAERLSESGLLRALADLTAVEQVTASIAPVFELPQKVYVDLGLDRKLRIAVLAPPVDKVIELARFFELACQNRGWQARIFTERDRAIEWLCAETGSGSSG